MEIDNPTPFSCSLCLLKITKEQVLHCGKCMKRIYCSKTCQRRDWKRKGNKDAPGQGHSSWCGVVNYGEEFVDWIIVPVPEKGDGIVALKNIPPNFRVMIDGFGIADILNNCGRDNKLYHSTKLNHSCNPNAARFMDVEFKVAIVYSTKDINAGEEITINYYSEMANPENIRNLFSGQEDTLPRDPILVRDDMDTKRKLYQDHGIICDLGCFCFKPEVVTACREANELWLMMKNEGDQVLHVQKLVNKFKVIGVEPMFQALLLEMVTNYWGCNNNNQEWIKEARDIYSATLHPKSSIISRVNGKLEL